MVKPVTKCDLEPRTTSKNIRTY